MTILLLTAFATVNCQVEPEIKRPKIEGVAHIALYVKNIDQSRAFYEKFLGFAEAYSLNKPNSEDLAMIFVKINDRQLIEIFPETSPEADRFAHFAVETDDAEAMRKYLGSKGIKVPDKTPTGRTGNFNFTIPDPNGIRCEFVQYTPNGFTGKNIGKDMPDTRISKHMSHVGFMVANLDSALIFYRDILGFKETWRGSSDGRLLSWVNLKVPDGDDYIELMLFEQAPDRNRKGTMNHICLVVDDVAAAGKMLQSRTLPEGCKKPSELKTGINHKRQINYYDPDGTRTEVMEPNTADGLPVPSSDAPAPGFVKKSK